MNEIIKDLNIEKKIYEIRGKQVMLDSDLALLYKCANGTKTINLAVKRHIDRFPEDFYFQLTQEELNTLRFQAETSNNTSRFQSETLNDNNSRFQNGTLKTKQGQNIKYIPHVFTEQGVAMLATVLRTSIAAEVSIKIMRAFVAMRKYISTGLIEQQYINNLVFKHEDDINKIFDYFERKEITNKLYLNGQIYDAYSDILDILRLGKEEVIIVDPYSDKYVLDIISKLKIKVLLITSNKNRLKEIDVDKYNKEYNNLTIKYDDSFHDRFIIVDSKTLYNLGTSLNNAGSKIFCINKIERRELLDSLLKIIK